MARKNGGEAIFFALIAVAFAVIAFPFQLMARDMKDSAKKAQKREQKRLAIENLGRRKVTIPIVGENQKNEDGVSRQSLIKLIGDGDPVWLEREGSNPKDRNAVKVICHEGQIGYIGKDLSAELAAWMDRGSSVKGEVAFVAGGTWCKPAKGVWIKVWRDDREPKRVGKRSSGADFDHSSGPV